MTLKGIDYLEFTTDEPIKIGALFNLLGFELRERTSDGRKRLYAQGNVRFLVTKFDPKTKDHASTYFQKHGDGVCKIAFRSDSPREFLAHVKSRGAKVAEEFQVHQDSKTMRETAAIYSFGDVLQSYEKSEGAQFAPGFENVPATIQKITSVGLQTVDHLTNNVDMGDMREWSDFYQKVYGFKVTREFDIRTGRTGLISEVLESQDGSIKIPINEATDKLSQVQEFVVQHKGAGVQHIAFTTPDIIATVKELRRRGLDFLVVPPTYYEAIPKRVPNVREPMKELQDLNILVDGDSKGYILQIFSQTVIGPLFFEFIQREENKGFGEGNFRALFEAIELDQERRGIFEKKG